MNYTYRKPLILACIIRNESPLNIAPNQCTFFGKFCHEDHQGYIQTPVIYAV